MMNINLKWAQLLPILFTALLLASCSGGSSGDASATPASSTAPSGSNVTSANGTATFSGTGTVDIPTGTTFTASTAKVNDVTVPAPLYQVIIYGAKSTATDTIFISYSESQSPFGTTYAAVLTFTSPTQNIMWRADSVGTQVPGVTFDKVARTIQLTNVNATAMITTPTLKVSDIVMNGTFNY